MAWHTLWLISQQITVKRLQIAASEMAILKDWHIGVV